MSAERAKAAMSLPKAISLITNKYSVSVLIQTAQMALHGVAALETLASWFSMIAV